jgi:4-hydroxy-3-methylbut-2-enyl diphosphate reductase
VLVDVGTKSEGIIPPGELTRESGKRPEQIVQVGEEIDVYVLNTDDDEAGHLILSKKRADFEKAWSRVIEAQRHGETLSAFVTELVKGGLVVDLGIRGFVPASHVGTGKVRNLETYLGMELPLKVIEVDRDRRKVVLSHRLATEQGRQAARVSSRAALAEGQIRAGVVRRITDYGAFVDIGGVEGLLHISEMSWTRIKHPNDVLQVGDEIQVMILKNSLDQGRISLGLRQILPDPWTEALERYTPGNLIPGTVTRLVPLGAFVQLEGGLEGIVPNSELSIRRVSKPEDVVQVGDNVLVKILEIRPDVHRMTLSMCQAQVELGDCGDYQPDPERVIPGDVYGAQPRYFEEDELQKATIATRSVVQANGNEQLAVTPDSRPIAQINDNEQLTVTELLNAIRALDVALIGTLEEARTLKSELRDSVEEVGQWLRTS